MEIMKQVKTLHESVRQQIENRNRVYANKANKRRKKAYFSLIIEFGCICIMSDFQPKWSPSYISEEMGLFKSWKRYMTMHIKLICQVSMVSMLPLIFFYLTMFNVSDDDSRLNSSKREGIMRISPSPSVVTQMTCDTILLWKKNRI